MADMTLCLAGGCPKKYLCERFTAPWSARQSVFGSIPYLRNPEAPCPEFVSNGRKPATNKAGNEPIDK
jgi:hypothetical protein